MLEKSTNNGKNLEAQSRSSNKLLNGSALQNSDLTKLEEKSNWYIALYQFDAVESNDLPLKPGDHINVIESKDEWWKGISNGKSGIFPANYVQKATLSSSSNFYCNKICKFCI